MLLSTAVAFFITGACLTAGLPLKEPSNQQVHSPAEALVLGSTIQGNNAFIMVCSFLALLLVPAVATLYASFRNLDAADLATKTFLTAAVIGMWWVWVIFSAVWSQSTHNSTTTGILGVLWTNYMFKVRPPLPLHLPFTSYMSVCAFRNCILQNTTTAPSR